MFRFKGLNEAASSDNGAKVEDIKPGEFMAIDGVGVFNLHASSLNSDIKTDIPFPVENGEVQNFQEFSGSQGDFKLRRNFNTISIMGVGEGKGFSYYDPNRMENQFCNEHELNIVNPELVILNNYYFIVIPNSDYLVYIVPVTFKEFRERYHAQRFDGTSFHLQMDSLVEIAREKIAKINNK